MFHALTALFIANLMGCSAATVADSKAKKGVEKISAEKKVIEEENAKEASSENELTPKEEDKLLDSALATPNPKAKKSSKAKKIRRLSQMKI
jgi:hypothetical protein